MMTKSIAAPLVLSSVSHPELGDVPVLDGRLEVGRDEAPFDSCAPAIAASLSRRHAQIFGQDDIFFITSLDARRSTTLNGRKVRAPLRLRHGDEVKFGDVLRFRAVFTNPSATDSTPRKSRVAPRVTLVPMRASSGAAIVVSEFPYGIGKAGLRAQLGSNGDSKALPYVSRHHAWLFVRAGHVYVQDQNSRNGTFLCDARIGKRPVQLSEGDTLAFGKEQFAYKVQLDTLPVRAPEAPVENARTVADKSQDANTTYLDSASSFMDMFCPPDRALRAIADAQKAEMSAEEISANAGVNRRPGIIRRLWRVAADLKQALGEPSPGQRRRPLAFGAIAVLLISVLVGGWYLTGAAERDMKALMVNGQYEQASLRSADYLRRRPADEAVKALATEAVLKAKLPIWLVKLEAADFAAARLTLARARRMSRQNDEALALLDLLDWVGSLEQLLHKRGGTDAPIVMFQHEGDIAELVEYWNRDVIGHRHAMGRILGYLPAFQPLHAQTFSHLRQLSNEKSLYLEAIEKLKTGLRQAIQAEHVHELQAMLDDFATKYPTIGGVDKLRADTALFVQLSRDIETGNLLEALQLLDDSAVLTPLFREEVARLKASALPEEAVAAEFERAADEWRTGNLAEALGIWEGLRDGRWGNLAARYLARNTELLERFETLRAQRQATDYAEQLVAFRLRLDEKQDGLLVSAIDADFQRHKQAFVKKANAAIQHAERLWKAYSENGGIRGLQRLENAVSAVFSEQATRLSSAFRYVSEGRRVHVRLNDGCSQACNRLFEVIVNESELQRLSLKELNMVLEPDVLKAKLALIPDPAPMKPEAPDGSSSGIATTHPLPDPVRRNQT